MNQYLLELYEREIKNIEGSLYYGQTVDMNNPKEVAAMFYGLGYSKCSQEKFISFGNDLAQFFPPGFHGSN